jgi:hypothetical protein
VRGPGRRIRLVRMTKLQIEEVFALLGLGEKSERERFRELVALDADDDLLQLLKLNAIIEYKSCFDGGMETATLEIEIRRLESAAAMIIRDRTERTLAPLEKKLSERKWQLEGSSKVMATER